MGTHHMSTGGHLVDPDSLQALDEAVKIAGALSLFAGLALSMRAGWKRWWHRRRDRQERLLKEAIKEIRDELAAHTSTVSRQLIDIDTKVADVVVSVSEIRKSQLEHLTDHAKGVFRTA